MPLVKLKLRAKLKNQRKSMDLNQVNNLSKIIQKNLLTLPEISQSNSFFTYVSINNEVQTHNLISFLLSQEKIVTIPKIYSWGDIENNKPGKMFPHQIYSLSQLKLENNFFNPSTPQYAQDLDIAICPVLAVSENMERLGMGGGFYDKFVENYPNMKLIALAYEWQVKKELPTNPHDKLLDIIITENRIIRANITN